MATTTGVELIRNERLRQIFEEAWTIDHDVEEHACGELAGVAAALIVDGVNDLELADPDAVERWAHGLVEKSRGDRVRQLTIAGALVAAEIDRLLR